MKSQFSFNKERNVGALMEGHCIVREMGSQDVDVFGFFFFFFAYMLEAAYGCDCKKNGKLQPCD